MELAGAVVLITGASRGIGAALATELADRGARLVLSGRDGAALEGVAAATGATPVLVDVRAEGAPDQLVAAALDTHGRLDAVVANAGIGHAGPFGAMDDQRIAALVETNLTAPIQLCRAAVPVLRRDPDRDAAIVLIGSIAGLLGVAGEAVYSASKAGLATFADTLRDELQAPPRVRVTYVAPGVVDTALLSGRGESYARRFPRPMPPARLARRVADAVEHGTEQVIEPRWLAVAERVGAVAPRTYRRLARRFG